MKAMHMLRREAISTRFLPLVMIFEKNAMLPGVYQNSGARLERLEDTSSLPTSKN